MSSRRKSEPVSRLLALGFLAAGFAGCGESAVEKAPAPVTQKTTRTSVDKDGDGRSDREVTESSNVMKNGTLISTSVDEKGTDGHKKAHVDTKYQYANGQMTGKSIEYDDDGDGVVDRSEKVSLHYGPKGVLTRDVFERYKPGSPQPIYRSVTTFAYDADSKGAPGAKVMEIDEDANGSIDSKSSYVFKYNNKGSLLAETEEQVEASTGKVRSRTEASYSYDEKGALLEKIAKIDSNGDNVIDHRETNKWAYGSGGSPKSKTTEYDDDADGKVDRREVSLNP